MRSFAGIARRYLAAAIMGAAALAPIVAQPKAESSPQGGASAEFEGGIVVVAVDPASPADKAGVRRGDILLKADKIELAAAQDLEFYVSRLKPGVAVSLEVSRGGERRSISVELAERGGRPYLGLVAQGEGDRLGFAPRLTPGPFGGPGAVEAVVAEVVVGSPAEAAGVKQGDAILSVDGARLQAGGSLAAEVAKRKPGDKVTLELRRAGGAVDKVEVTLAASPESATRAYLGVRYREALGQDFRMPPGFPWPIPTPNLTPPAGLPVREVAAGSPAESAGLKPGDVITTVADEQLSASTPLADLVARYKPGEAVELTVTDSNGANERKVRVVLGARPDDKEKAYLGVVTGGWRGVPNDERPLPRGRMQPRPQGPRATDI